MILSNHILHIRAATLSCDGKNLAPGMTQSHFCSQLATNYGPDCFQNKRTECFRPRRRRQVTSHVRSDSSHSRKESGGNKCCLSFIECSNIHCASRGQPGSQGPGWPSPRISQRVPAYSIIIHLGSNDHNINKQFDGVLSSL